MINTPPDHAAGEGSAYRAYLIGTDGRITTSIDIEAANDIEAIHQTKAIDHLGAMELWDRGRVVLRRSGNPHRYGGGR